MFEVAGVVFPHFRCDREIGTEERGPQFRDEFFHCVAFISPFLPAEISIEPAGVPRPMGQLMGKRRRVTLGVSKTFKRRHLNIIFPDGVVRPVSTGPDVGLRLSEKRLGVLDPLHSLFWCFGQGVEMSGQSFALLGIENEILLEERNLLFGFLAVLGRLLLLEGASVKGK